MQRDCSLFSGWRATPDTLWYFWDHYGRLAGYDAVSRRFIGSLGPNGFARDIAGQGDRFRKPGGGGQSRSLMTDTTVFLVDVEQRTVKTLLTTTKDDPILGVNLIVLNGYDWEYTALVTKRFIQLLTADAKPLWKIPYEPAYPDYTGLAVDFLEPAGQFAVWITPNDRGREHPNRNLPSRVTWLARDQGIVKSLDLPALPEPHYKPRAEESLFGCAMPPGLIAALNRLKQEPWPVEMRRPLLLLSLGTAVLICLPIGWWLGRRYSLPLRAQVGWAVFLLLGGLPGLLAFLSVQEWPAREACPNCQRLRLVDGSQCEHCGADFAPPEKTGTEVFVPLGAKVEVQAGG